MDEKLIAWARAVKARRRWIGSSIPPLWIFSDRERLPDPRAILARMPKGLCGLVYRPGGVVDPCVAAGLARLCRQRRFPMVVAGDPRVAAALQAGRHLSGGRRGVRGRARGGHWVTAPAHGRAALAWARRTGVDAVFLSPVFATASHPGAPGLGPVRWSAMARLARCPVLALGGVTGMSARRLPWFCAGAGVIGAASRPGVTTSWPSNGLAFAGAKG